MIPQGTAAVAAFFLFVAPGLTWELMGERFRPSVGVSNFREAARVALTSVVFSAFALAVLVLLRVSWPSSMPDVGKWLASKKGQPTYAQSHYALIARAVVLEVAIACGVAALI